MDRRIETLAELWRQWAVFGRDLPEGDWDRATRLPRWNVRHVYAHHSWSISFLASFAGNAVDRPAEVTGAADWFGIVSSESKERGVDAQIAEMALTDAAATTTADLVDRFMRRGPETLEEVGRTGNVVVDAFGRTIRLFDYVDVAVVEAVIHLLDVQRALDRPAEIPDDGLTRTVGVLSEMVPPIAFIEAATGRAPAPLPVLT